MEPQFTIEEVTDPVEIARFRAQQDQFKRNSDWLQAHWADVLPQARGKFLAVAGQEAYIADSIEQALAWIAAKHPEDQGAHTQYVIPEEGPRIYDSRRGVVVLRGWNHASGSPRLSDDDQRLVAPGDVSG